MQVTRRFQRARLVGAQRNHMALGLQGCRQLFIPIIGTVNQQDIQRPRCAVSLQQRQLDRKCAAFAAARTERINLPAVKGYNAFHQCQAEAKPATAPIGRQFGLCKQFEDARQQVRIDPHTVIRNADDNEGNTLLHRELDASALLRVFGRIVQQVGQHLHQPGIVAQHARSFILHVQDQLLVARFD